MIRVELFGKFRILVDHRDATQALGNSKKGRLMLEYLILHQGESIASSDLYELLWPTEEIANPESALKTLVSRTRSALSRFDPMLGKCILTSRSSYRWNIELPYEVDVFEFEALYRELMRATAMSGDTAQQFERAFSVYGGDLCTWTDSGSWIISRNAYYHTLFVRLAHHAIHLMKEAKDDESIISVCRRGLEVDMLDETMHLSLMDALVRLKRTNEALLHYKRAQDIHFTQYGLRLPEKIENFYKQIIQAEQTLEMDIESIRASLHQCEADGKGAYACEYAIFKELFWPLTQNLLRAGQPVFLALLMLSPSNPKARRTDKSFASTLDRAMEDLRFAIMETLGEYDVISRYSCSQYVLLLTGETQKQGQEALHAIESVYAKKRQTGCRLRLTYTLIEVE